MHFNGPQIHNAYMSQCLSVCLSVWSVVDRRERGFQCWSSCGWLFACSVDDFDLVNMPVYLCLFCPSLSVRLWVVERRDRGFKCWMFICVVGSFPVQWMILTWCTCLCLVCLRVLVERRGRLCKCRMFVCVIDSSGCSMDDFDCVRDVVCAWFSTAVFLSLRTLGAVAYQEGRSWQTVVLIPCPYYTLPHVIIFHSMSFYITLTLTHTHTHTIWVLRFPFTAPMIPHQHSSAQF